MSELVALTLFFGVLMGQLSTASHKQDGDFPSAQMLAEPRAGMPLSVEQTEEYSLRSAGGSKIQFTVNGKTFRDSHGRVRQDSVTQDATGVQVSSQSFLLDPLKNSAFLLLPKQRIAYEIPFPQITEAHLLHAHILDESDSPRDQWSVETNDLGVRSLEGNQFTGKRFAYTAADDPHRVKKVELWYSEALRLTGRIVASGPKRSHTVEIQNLYVQEQDDSLFKVPADFRVLQIGWPE